MDHTLKPKLHSLCLHQQCVRGAAGSTSGPPHPAGELGIPPGHVGTPCPGGAGDTGGAGVHRVRTVKSQSWGADSMTTLGNRHWEGPRAPRTGWREAFQIITPSPAKQLWSHYQDKGFLGGLKSPEKPDQHTSRDTRLGGPGPALVSLQLKSVCGSSDTGGPV